MGMCSCIESIIKHLLYGLNAILLILGFVLLGAGIWCQVEDPTKYTKDIADADVKKVIDDIISQVQMGGIPMIIIAGTIVGTTILGICVASKKSKILLAIYFVLMLLVLTGMVVGTILAFTKYLDEWATKINSQIRNKDPEIAEKMEHTISYIKGLGLTVSIFIITALGLNLVSTCVFFNKGTRDGDLV